MLVYFLNYLFHLKNLADLGNYLGILSLFIRNITDCLYRINSIIAVVCCVIYLFLLTVEQHKKNRYQDHHEDSVTILQSVP